MIICLPNFYKNHQDLSMFPNHFHGLSLLVSHYMLRIVISMNALNVEGAKGRTFEINLKEYANHKLENYIYLLFLRGKFLTLIRLLSFPRLRRRFINLLRRKIGGMK